MSTVDEALAALGVFKNVILEGPPGTGKSFSIAEIAAAWPRPLGVDAQGLVADGSGFWAVTFHPSTGYEEFVEGIRYNSEIDETTSKATGFELRSGVFRHWVSTAMSQPHCDFLVLIDEINRANVSKVLGDLLLGLESSKRLRHDPACELSSEPHTSCWVGGTTTQLAYSNDLLGVPDNLYLLGTMNSSDRSIAPLDSALRRRFAFIRVAPLCGDLLKDRLKDALPAVGNEIIDRSVAALDQVNRALAAALGPDNTLGHSYLFGLGDVGASSYWIEVNSGSVASSSQFQVIQDWATALLDAVAPGASIKASGTSVDLQVEYDGQVFDVKLEHPANKPNTQFSASRVGFKAKMTAGGITVWTPLGLRRLRLDFVPGNGRTEQLVQNFLERSSDWRSDPTAPRAFGRIDTGMRRGDRDERVVWRHSILPQLIDTVTQAYAPDFLVPGLRERWLGEAIPDEHTVAVVLNSLQEFDRFLSKVLGYQIVRSGHGLSAGLVIEEIAAQLAPVDGAVQEIVADTNGNADDSGS